MGQRKDIMTVHQSPGETRGSKNTETSGLLAKDSALYRVLGDAVSLLYAYPTEVLPTMNRVGGFGVGQHDRVFNGSIAPVGFEHEFDRFLNTQELVMGVVFGGSERADIAYAVRELHRDVHGKMLNGEKYHAWNPRLWRWFWLGSVSAWMRIYDSFRGFPSSQFREETYLGFVELGGQFGVRDMPATYDDFIAFWPGERELFSAATPQARFLADQLTSAMYKPTFARWLPTWLWCLLTLPLRRVLRISLLVGFVPEQNALIGIRSNRLDRWELVIHRVFWRAIPLALSSRSVPTYFYLRGRFGQPSWRRHYSREQLDLRRQRNGQCTATGVEVGAVWSTTIGSRND